MIFFFTKEEVYHGKLIEAEDNMNCQMTAVQVTYRDGRVAQLENIYIRGSKIRFLILPDMLKNAPMFKNMGRGKRKNKIIFSTRCRNSRAKSLVFSYIRV